MRPFICTGGRYIWCEVQLLLSSVAWNCDPLYWQIQSPLWTVCWWPPKSKFWDYCYNGGNNWIYWSKGTGKNFIPASRDLVGT